MDQIKENFQKHVDHGLCNGAEWKIKFKDKLYHDSIGFRDLDKKKELSKNLHYRIWSMTKPIVSFAAMQLIDKNYLCLNDTIDMYFPNYSKVNILNENSQNIIA